MWLSLDKSSELGANSAETMTMTEDAKASSGPGPIQKSKLIP